MKPAIQHILCNLMNPCQRAFEHALAFRVAHASRVSRPASRRTPALGLGRDAQAGTRDARATQTTVPSLQIIAALSAAAALALAGCKPVAQEEPEAPAATEVAVHVAKVARTTLRAHVEAYGVAEPEPAANGKPAGAARLSAPAAGIVAEVPVREGDTVEAGALIVRLDDRLASAMVDRASHALEFAKLQSERQEKLKNADGTSLKAIQEAAQQLATARAELEAAQAQLAQVRLVSPMHGVVARINAQPGQAVDLNTVLAEIVDTERLVFTAGVPASEAAALKSGQPAEIFAEGRAVSPKPPRSSPDIPGGFGVSSEATGSTTALPASAVIFVSPLVDAATGTVPVRVSIPKGAAMRPGQFARVRIVSEERAGRLAVPVESVVTNAEGHSVIFIVTGDTAVQKPVKTGVRDSGLVEVESGELKESDTVVTTGAYGLPKETKVRVLNPTAE